jgi:hypothetical protein
MTKTSFLRPLVYLCCLAVDLIAWSILLFAKVVLGGTLEIRNGVLLLFCKKPLPTFRGMTFGHAIIIEIEYKDNEKLMRHEMFHVKQIEAAAVTGGILAAFFAFMGLRWSLLVFAFMPWISYYASSLTAWMLGGRIYRDNHLELGARGIDDHPEGV